MIELDIDPKLKIKNIEDVFTLPQVITVNNFTEESANEFREEFYEAQNTGQDVIPIVIDSYGGSVDALISMLDVIEACPVPVATIAIGKAMSCGSILLTCGTEGYRYVAPRARVLIHPITSMSWGNLDDVNVKAKELKRLVKLCFHMMAKNCGLEKDFFINKMKEKRNADWILTPKECKKLNIAQHIGMPKFNVYIKTDVSFGV